MRWGAAIIVLSMLGGCAAHRPSATTQPAVPHRYQRSAAGSLAFDPPVTLGQPPLNLSREGRSPDAFVSYDSVSTTYFYLRVDDRMRSDHGDRYERRAISTKVGVSYR